MYMRDWIEKLHGFLTLNDREILEHKGKISHEEAAEYETVEFEKYQKQLLVNEPDELDKAIKRLNPSKK